SGGGRRRAGRLRRRGDPGRAVRGGRRGRHPSRAAGHNAVHALPGVARRAYRGGNRALPARGHAAGESGRAMTVTIIMHGTLRRFLPDGAARATLDLRAGATIEEVLVGLGAEQDTWVVARNQTVAERDVVLAPGDVLDCFEPVSGG